MSTTFTLATETDSAGIRQWVLRDPEIGLVSTWNGAAGDYAGAYAWAADQLSIHGRLDKTTAERLTTAAADASEDDALYPAIPTMDDERAHEWLAALSDDDLQQEYTLTDDEGGDTEEIMDEMTRRGMIPAMPEFKPHRGDNGISLADDDAWPQGKVNEMYLLINGAWTVARYHTLAQVFFHDAPEVHTRDDAEAALKRYFEQVWSAYRAECAGR